GAFTWSLTVSVAVTVASSLQTRSGVSVPAPDDVHCVPGSPTHENAHEYDSVSPSRSLAVACSDICVPSRPTYGPPASAVGGVFTSTSVLEVSLPPLSSVTVTVIV